MELNGGIFKFFEGETIHFLGHEYFIEEVTANSMRFTGVTTPDTILFRNNKGAWVNDDIISNDVLNVTFEEDYLRIILIADDDIKKFMSKRRRENMCEKLQNIIDSQLY